MIYNRILLKLSGEALLGERQYGIDPDRISQYAKDIKSVTKLGVQVAVVIGGGNIFRGVSAASNGMDRVQADYMGMLATVINGLALQSALEETNIPTRLQTAIKIEAVAEAYIKRKAVRHLEKGRVVIFGGGTGGSGGGTAQTAYAEGLQCVWIHAMLGGRVQAFEKYTQTKLKQAYARHFYYFKYATKDVSGLTTTWNSTTTATNTNTGFFTSGGALVIGDSATSNLKYAKPGALVKFTSPDTREFLNNTLVILSNVTGDVFLTVIKAAICCSNDVCCNQSNIRSEASLIS